MSTFIIEWLPGVLLCVLVLVLDKKARRSFWRFYGELALASLCYAGGIVVACAIWG